MRLARLALLVVPVLGLGLLGPSEAATRPQVQDDGGDQLATKSQDIRSVTFRSTGSGRTRALVVTMTMSSPVMPEVPVFTYEVRATTSSCGALELTHEPGTPYEAVTGLNGWSSLERCGGTQDLLTAHADGFDIRWTIPIPAAMKRGTVFSGFEASVDVSNPAVPFPASTTGTAIGLVDSARGTGTWRLP
jgi:hypothetical protein